MSRRIWNLEKLVAAALVLSAGSGCATRGTDRAALGGASIAGTPATDETPYSESLRCLRRYTATRPVRIVVGPIADHGLTNDAALMTVSALAKAGVPLAKHFGTAVATREPRHGGDTILARAVPGSDFYLAGEVTGLDVETDSHAAIYRVRLGLDLRLVDIDTLQLVDVISYQRQMSGSHLREPVRAAVRSAIERAMLELVSRLYRVPENACTSQLGGPADPLAGPGDPPPVGSVALNEYARQSGDS